MAKIEVTVPMVDWLLYNLPALRTQVEEAGAGGGVPGPGSRHADASNPTAAIAVCRASLSVVLDTAEKTVHGLHPESRKVYRLKYRERLSYGRIAHRAFISDSTAKRRANEIRAAVKAALSLLPQSTLREFVAFTDGES